MIKVLFISLKSMLYVIDHNTYVCTLSQDKEIVNIMCPVGIPLKQPW